MEMNQRFTGRLEEKRTKSAMLCLKGECDYHCATAATDVHREVMKSRKETGMLIHDASTLF